MANQSYVEGEFYDPSERWSDDAIVAELMRGLDCSRSEVVPIVRAGFEVNDELRRDAAKASGEAQKWREAYRLCLAELERVTGKRSWFRSRYGGGSVPGQREGLVRDDESRFRFQR